MIVGVYKDIFLGFGSLFYNVKNRCWLGVFFRVWKKRVFVYYSGLGGYGLF